MSFRINMNEQQRLWLDGLFSLDDFFFKGHVIVWWQGKWFKYWRIDVQGKTYTAIVYPIASMYGIFTYI